MPSQQLTMSKHWKSCVSQPERMSVQTPSSCDSESQQEAEPSERQLLRAECATSQRTKDVSTTAEETPWRHHHNRAGPPYEVSWSESCAKSRTTICTAPFPSTHRRPSAPRRRSQRIRKTTGAQLYQAVWSRTNTYTRLCTVEFCKEVFPHVFALLKSNQDVFLLNGRITPIDLTRHRM